jgi:hypothetical protein
VAGQYYWIRVAGTLPPEVLADFEQIRADVEPVATVLEGQLADQAALQGLFARLELFGVQVLEVHRLRSQAVPPQN